MNKSSIIPYSLPKRPPKHYFEKALEILQEIEKQCPMALPIFLRSDIAITLSGVRAYDAYVGELSNLLAKEDIEKLKNLLEQYNIFLESDDSEYLIDNDEEPYFYLINEDALKQIPNQYQLDAWIEPKPPYGKDRFMAWSFAVESDIHQDMVQERLPHRWSNDYWAPGIIREGLLYGYPAIAITSYIDWNVSMSLARNPAEEPGESLDSDIAYHDMYFAPHVGYSYPKELQKDETIKKHQKLWSEILTNIYESDWHKELKQNNEFKKSLAIIEAHENN